MTLAGLFLILAAVLFAPFLIKKVEEELEIFLFLMGALAVTITAQWDLPLIKEALLEPVKITLAVFIAGFLFKYLQKPIALHVNKIAEAVGLRFFAFMVIVALGLLSGVITVIIAALVLVEIVAYLSLDRKNEILFVVLTCFSIGMGAALTPIGGPLATIAIAKLRGEPYHAGFFFLFRELWHFIIPGIVILGFLGVLLMPARRKNGHDSGASVREETFKDMVFRTAKVYLFIMAVVLLGNGYRPIIDTYISKIPYQGLFWLNMISAVLDNATVTAAEIGPGMGLLQIKSALLGLVISGGMLIPGNIPNIIAAGKLKIKNSEWARYAVPMGLSVMAVCFLILVFLKPAG